MTGEPAGILQAKVLTVSDGVVAGTREDRSGQALVETLVGAGWHVVARRVVADGTDSVAGALREMTSGFRGVVVTTGGTGFAPRDLTPEGTIAVLDRQAPGLAEAMRAANPGFGREQLDQGRVQMIDPSGRISSHDVQGYHRPYGIYRQGDQQNFS